MRRAAVWSRLGLVLAGAAFSCAQSGGAASAEPYQFASPPGKDSILVFKLDVPTGEVQACGYQSVQGGVGQTRCYPIGEGAGPQQPGRWALHTANHEKEYGVVRVNAASGAISYCYLTFEDVTVCTQPLAAEAGPVQAAAGAAEAEPYRFASPPGTDSVLVFRLDVRTGEVQACDFQSVPGGVGETECHPIGEGAGPQQPGSWALHVTNHRQEYGVSRVNADTGAVSYCYLTHSDMTVCTAPLAAQPAQQAQAAPAPQAQAVPSGKVQGGMPAPMPAPQLAPQPAVAAGGPSAGDGPYRFISPPAINSIRVYRLDTRTGEVVGCEYASVQGGIGETKCYPPGTGAMPNRPGRWALHAANHEEEHGVVRVNEEDGQISYCYVAAGDTTVCTEMAQLGGAIAPPPAPPLPPQ